MEEKVELTPEQRLQMYENLSKVPLPAGLKTIVDTSTTIQRELIKDPNWLYNQKYKSQIQEWQDVNRKLADIEAQRNVQLWTFDDEGKLQVNPNLPEGGRKSAEELAGKYGLELGKQYAPQIDLVTPIKSTEGYTYIANPCLSITASGADNLMFLLLILYNYSK